MGPVTSVSSVNETAGASERIDRLNDPVDWTAIHAMVSRGFFGPHQNHPPPCITQPANPINLISSALVAREQLQQLRTIVGGQFLSAAGNHQMGREQFPRVINAALQLIEELNNGLAALGES
jgi:hypothetical protein